MVKAGADRLLSVWTVSIGGAVLAIPVLAWSGLPPTSVLPLIAASAVVQTGYMLSLSKSYQVGDLAFVYPVARGVSPVLISVIGVVLLNDEIGLGSAVGVVIVTLALFTLALSRSRRDGIWWALLTGLTITAYTLLDAAAARTAGSALPVVMSVFLVQGVLLTTIVVQKRGAMAISDHLRHSPGRSAFGAVAGTISYGLVVSATLLAPVGLVSAVRETSVVLGVIAGKRVLGEVVSARHVAVVVAGAAGALLIALS